MIQFEVIRWKNLLSSGNIFTEIVLNKSPTTLIIGENGAGKSTFLDALTFALFGKPYRKISKPQLVNSINNKGTIVELEFSIGKQKYKIIRGIRPNLFEVYKNGSLLNQSADSKDYQEILEKHILKLNYKSFCQVVILGSTSFIPFMQLSSQNRREIIEDLLDLQIFTTMNTLLKDKINQNDNSILECYNSQQLIEEKIKLIRQHMEEIQNSNVKLIEEKKEIAEDTLKQIETLTREIEEQEEKIQEMKSSLSEQDTLTKKLKKLDSLRHKIDAKLAIIQKNKDFFETHEDCPTCTQLIDEDFRNNAILDKDKEIKEINIGLLKLDEQREEINTQLNKMISISSEIQTLSLALHKKQSSVESLNQYVKQIQKEINHLDSQDNTQVNAQKIVDLQEENQKFEDQYNTLQGNRKILSVMGLMLKDGGIKAKIIKQYVPIINKLINKYLSVLDFFVQFELDENFEETIKSRFRDEFTYESFSEGEKMRINLAVLFTWRTIAKLRNSINTNLLIMDEVFDSSLDVNGTEEFLKLMNGLIKDTNTFIISHKQDQMIDKFQQVIKFVKHQSFSRIAA